MQACAASMVVVENSEGIKEEDNVGRSCLKTIVRDLVDLGCGNQEATQRMLDSRMDFKGPQPRRRFYGAWLKNFLGKFDEDIFWEAVAALKVSGPVRPVHVALLPWHKVRHHVYLTWDGLRRGKRPRPANLAAGRMGKQCSLANVKIPDAEEKNDPQTWELPKQVKAFPQIVMLTFVCLLSFC